MNKDNKIFLIALSITTVILLYSTIVLFVIKESEKDKRIALQKRLDEVIVAKQDVETRMREMELLSVEIRSDLKLQREKVSMLTERLEEEKKLCAKYSGQLQQREFEMQSLKTKLQEEEAEKESLLKRLEKMNEEYLGLKFQLENLMKTKEEMEAKARELADKEGVSLGTIVINQSR